MGKVLLKSIELPNGETIGYREREGGEKTLLLIHGNMTSSKHWDVFIDALPAIYKIYAVDLRGFGISTYHKPISTIKDFSEDVYSFVKSIQLHDFALMGWSLGGSVAMQFSADHPEYVKELVLLTSGSTRGYPFVSFDKDGEPTKRLSTLKEVQQDPIKTIPIQSAYDTKNKEFLKNVWNAGIYTTNQPSLEKYDEYVEDMTTQRNLADSYQALNIFNISDTNNGLVDGNGDVNSIQAPTLVLYGEHDLVVTKSMTDEVVADLPNNPKVVMLKNCGHSPLVDDLDQLVQAVDQFLMVEERSSI